MLTQFQFLHTTEALKEDIKTYALERFAKLEKFLKTFQEDDTLLILTVEYQEKHTYFHLRTALHVGGETLYHEEKAHDPKQAIDATQVNLAERLKKLVDEIRQSHSTKVHAGRRN